MLRVGQKLWWVGNRSAGDGRQREVTVVSVGRKWATLDCKSGYPIRNDIETLWADGKGFWSPGRCYLSKQEYDDERLQK